MKVCFFESLFRFTRSESQGNVVWKRFNSESFSRMERKSRFDRVILLKKLCWLWMAKTLIKLFLLSVVEKFEQSHKQKLLRQRIRLSNFKSTLKVFAHYLLYLMGIIYLLIHYCIPVCVFPSRNFISFSLSSLSFVTKQGLPALSIHVTPTTRKLLIRFQT